MEKIAEKYLTRDAPLILIEGWCKGRVKYFKDFFGIDFPKTIFLSSNGVFEFYIDLADFDFKFPQKLSQWVSIEGNRKKLAQVRQFMREGLDYFKNMKIKQVEVVALIGHLRRVKELCARGYPGVLVTHHFPRWYYQFQKSGSKLFDAKLVKEIMKWREVEGNIFMDQGSATVYRLLKAIAKKKKLNTELLKYITFKELSEVVLHKKLLPSAELRKRRDTKFIFLNSRIIYEPVINRRLKNIHLQLKSYAVSDKAAHLRGTTANRGYAQGRARVIFNRQQLPLVKRGEILIAPMTAPWYLPVIGKVSAIVTDEGGVASHAAIISREFNKPCVIGTKIATKIFRDGDMVEIDATKGIIRKL